MEIYTLKTLRKVIDETKVVVTHAGRFHADDVLSLAMVSLMCKINYKNPDDDHVLDFEDRLRTVAINRVTDKDKIVNDNGFVCDIGGGQFDHHDGSNLYRDEAKEWPFASLGLIWKTFGREFIREKLEAALSTDNVDFEIVETVANMVDDEFIKYVDRTDCYGPAKYPNPLSTIIGAMNEDDVMSSSQNVAFFEEVEKFVVYLRKLLNTYVNNGVAIAESRNPKIVDVMKGVAVCKKHIAARLLKPRALYVVEPNARSGGYSVISVDSEKFPISKDVAERYSATFIHSSKFMAVFSEKENAIAAALEMASNY